MLPSFSWYKQIRGGLPLRKLFAALLFSSLLVFAVSCASAQVVSCPQAHLVLTVPDSWSVVPLFNTGDPDLCLLLEDRDMTLSVYVADAGGLVPEAFELFTGDETESGTVMLSGMEMTYVAGESPEGYYRIYTWLDRRNQVQLYFLVTAQLNTSQKVIDGIMESLEFR